VEGDDSLNKPENTEKEKKMDQLLNIVVQVHLQASAALGGVILPEIQVNVN